MTIHINRHAGQGVSWAAPGVPVHGSMLLEYGIHPAPRINEGTGGGDYTRRAHGLHPDPVGKLWGKHGPRRIKKMHSRWYDDNPPYDESPVEFMVLTSSDSGRSSKMPCKVIRA